MEAYFDNAATTKVFPEVKDLVVKLMEEDYGNPSSLHQKGLDAGHYILNYLANGTIAQCRGVRVYGCKGWNHSYGTGRVVKTDYTDISSDSDVTA